MSQKILVISGCKQAGKDSAMNYVAGYLLKQAGITNYFELDEKGHLLVECDIENPETGQLERELGRLDLTRMDADYVRGATHLRRLGWLSSK